MKPSVALSENSDAVRAVVLAHRARNPRVFGSAARGDDSAESDLDLLIDPTHETTLLDIGAIRQETARPARPARGAGRRGDAESVACRLPGATAGRSGAGVTGLRLSDHLTHILTAIQRINEYTAGLDATGFAADERTQDAVIRNIEVIGEASRRIQARRSA